MFSSIPFRRQEFRKVSTWGSRDRYPFVARCRRQGAMGHFITGVDLHIGTPRARVHVRGFRRAGRNWLYTAAHKTRQVIIGGIFRTAVPYWPRVRRVPLPVDGFTGRRLLHSVRVPSHTFCAAAITIDVGFSALKNRRFSTSLERNVRAVYVGAARHYLISNWLRARTI